jgi:methylglutaconyl-CoA hydratase
MSDGVLLYKLEDGVATLSLNRPAKRNALNKELVVELKAGLGRAAGDGEARVVAITGRGKDFCSGADLAELERVSAMSEEENLADARSLGELFSIIRALRLPVVSLVKGRALAGGCGLATACDMVLACSDAEFGYPEVHLGFVPAMAMAILRRKIPEGRAFDLVARGHRIGAEEARQIGLVADVFETEVFEAACRRRLQEIAARPPTAIALTKALLYDLEDLSFAEGLERGARVNVEARMTEACREGVRRFLDRSD